MTNWTSIVTGQTTYSKLTTPGSQIFDDATLTYDDASAVYDSTNYGLWSSVASANLSWTSIRS